jgi:hypothetical protein
MLIRHSVSILSCAQRDLQTSHSGRGHLDNFPNLGNHQLLIYGRLPVVTSVSFSPHRSSQNNAGWFSTHAERLFIDKLHPNNWSFHPFVLQLNIDHIVTSRLLFTRPAFGKVQRCLL